MTEKPDEEAIKEKMETVQKFLSLPESQRRLVIANASPDLAPLMQLLESIDENITVRNIALKNVSNYVAQLEATILSLHSSFKKEDEKQL